MKFHFLYFIAVVLLFSCKKEKTNKVEIYLLKSFSVTVLTQPPYATVINDAVLESEPLVQDNSIESFTKATTTFKLREDIGPIIKHFTADKGFAVTVDGKAVYLGIFHPAYLSSISFNIATIDPIMYDKQQLRIDFVLSDQSGTAQYDKRHDDRLLKALQSTGRLR